MELRDYLRIIRARWVGILLLTALGLAIAAGWATLQPRVYTASTSGYVASTGGGDDTTSSLMNDQLARSKVTSFLDIGSWRSVAEYAINELGLQTTPEKLVQQVSVSNPTETVVIHVSANAATPEAARDLAQSWVRGMVAEIDKIEGNGSAGSSVITLLPGDSARLPTSPSSPNVRLALALGGLIGFAAGIAYAIIRHVLDRRVRDPREVERVSGVAVVGIVPIEPTVDANVRIATTAASTRSHTPLSEAIRKLRTNLQFMSVDDPPRVIMLTSPLPGDGKSTVSANIAMSLATTGQKVLLIDADLRRPTVSETFGLSDGAGLSDLLAGRAELADLIQQVGDLSVLCAGSIPPNPTELLGSMRMRTLLDQLRADGFMVIVDCPPTIPVADAAALSNATDGVLMVASAGRTTYDALELALEGITRAHARVLGIVLNKVPRRGSSYYGYQYTGTYESRTPEAKPGPRRRARTATAA